MDTRLVISTWLVRIVGFYLLLGVIFAVPFVARGVNRVDPAAVKGTRGFRMLIYPGVVALWPLLASRLLRGVREPPPEKNAHRSAARPRNDDAPQKETAR